MQQTADQLFEKGDYNQALEVYEKIIQNCISEQRTAECKAYGKAGLAALETGDITKAVDYLKMDTYTPFATQETYYGMASAYRQIDNLSKELMALEDYAERYPTGKHISEVDARLFAVYVISENYPKAVQLWPKLNNEVQSSPDMLSHWFTVNLEMGNNQEVDRLADLLLQNNPQHIAALEWKAEKSYRSAESDYQREMKAYENNRTNRQYKIMLEALDDITAEFKIALGYYEKLYAINPKTEYAQYMSNIYVRFNDKEKADFYRRKAEQK
jgi:tetratricopeptide (TPR) repeat protein